MAFLIFFGHVKDLVHSEAQVWSMAFGESLCLLITDVNLQVTMKVRFQKRQIALTRALHHCGIVWCSSVLVYGGR